MNSQTDITIHDPDQPSWRAGLVTLDEDKDDWNLATEWFGGGIPWGGADSAAEARAKTIARGLDVTHVWDEDERAWYPAGQADRDVEYRTYYRLVVELLEEEEDDEEEDDEEEDNEEEDGDGDGDEDAVTTTTRTLTHADLLARIAAAPDTARIYMRSRWLWIELASSIIELELDNLDQQDPHGIYMRAEDIDPAWVGEGLELYYEDLPEDAYTGVTVTPEDIWDQLPDGTRGTPVVLVEDDAKAAE